MAAWDDRQTWRNRETVEQAALARATGNDWQGRARREAAAILDQVGLTAGADRGTLVGLLALAWMQGAIYGSHETLAEAEQAFQKLKDVL